MSLKWQGFSADQFIEELEASTARTRRDSKVELRAGAKQILEASKEQCPVDKGNLEEAHTLNSVRLSADFMELEIDVGGVVNGVDVDEYAFEVHEFQTPFGPIGLGPKSQAKNDSNPPNRFVGGKFLDRAVDEYEDEIVKAVAETLPGD